MSEMSEARAHSLLIEHLRGAENAARMIGHARSDTRWIKYASYLGGMVETAEKAANSVVSRALIIAGREYHH